MSYTLITESLYSDEYSFTSLHLCFCFVLILPWLRCKAWNSLWVMWTWVCAFFLLNSLNALCLLSTILFLMNWTLHYVLMLQLHCFHFHFVRPVLAKLTAHMLVQCCWFNMFMFNKIIQVNRCQWHRNILSLWVYCSMLMHHWIMLIARDTSHHLSWQTPICSMYRV